VLKPDTLGGQARQVGGFHAIRPVQLERGGPKLIYIEDYEVRMNGGLRRARNCSRADRTEFPAAPLSYAPTSYFPAQKSDLRFFPRGH
jgi:hypothetical protein